MLCLSYSGPAAVFLIFYREQRSSRMESVFLRKDLRKCRTKQSLPGPGFKGHCGHEWGQERCIGSICHTHKSSAGGAVGAEVQPPSSGFWAEDLQEQAGTERKYTWCFTHLRPWQETPRMDWVFWGGGLGPPVLQVAPWVCGLGPSALIRFSSVPTGHQARRVETLDFFFSFGLFS
jgi:hypothetical protein